MNSNHHKTFAFKRIRARTHYDQTVSQMITIQKGWVEICIIDFDRQFNLYDCVLLTQPETSTFHPIAKSQILKHEKIIAFVHTAPYAGL